METKAKVLTPEEVTQAMIDNNDVVGLSEEGKYEVKILSGKFRKKPYKVVIRADFSKLNSAYASLFTVKDAGVKGKEPTVETDMIAAGDNLLFMAGIYGHTEAMQKPALRMKIANELGMWLAEIMSPEDEDGLEKKN